MKRLKITGIMASDPSGVVGVGPHLPWDCPEESAHFRRTVKGHMMIMGRKTYDATPSSALEGSVCFVLTRAASIVAKDETHDLYTVNSPGACLRKIQELPQERKIFLIGGAEIVRLFLESDLISDFILTKMHQCYAGDVILDLKPFASWKEEILSTHKDYTIYHLEKP